MLRDDIARYTELSGNDGEHTSIGIIGAFLDGYETGLKDRPKGEWILDETDNSVECNKCLCQIYPNDISYGEPHFCPNCGADMRGKAE